MGCSQTLLVLEMDVDLAQPEFDGLWDKQPAKADVDPLFNRAKYWKTKMDKVTVVRVSFPISKHYDFPRTYYNER